MKKSLLLVLFSLSFGLLMSASDGFVVDYNRTVKGTQQLSFELAEYSIVNTIHAGVQYSVVDFESTIRTNKKGWAELPFLSSTVMVAPDKNYDVKIISSEYEDVILENPILPSRGVIYRNQNPEEIPFQIDSKSIVDSWYPSKMVNADAPFILKDFRGISVKVFPFRYNAEKGILRVYKKMVVALVENNSKPIINALSFETNTILKEMLPTYQSVFVNFDEVKDDLTIGQYGDILVITPDNYSVAIEPYIQWKREKGFTVEMEIVPTGTEVTSLIQQKYDENNNLLYVQLVGDWADIKSTTAGGAPSDPVLGWVAGSDSYQDIAIGRFSANSPAEVTTQVNKVIAYEQTPDLGATWYKAALGIGSSQGSGTGDDGEMDKDHVQIIYDNKLSQDTYDTYSTSYDPGANSSQVATAVNDGLSVINYCGHGSENSWVTSGFSNSDVSNLSNGSMMPFIFSVACVNGAFHSGECFAEAWSKKENGGSIMALMSTINQPWTPPMRGQDYFNDILTGGYNYDNYSGQSGINTDEQRTTIGSIVVNGLVLMYTESSTSSDLETIQTWTLFGDASLEVRTDTPKDITLSNNVIMQGVDFTTTVSVAGSPMEGAMICISQGNDFYSGITDASGNVSLAQTLIPGDAKMVVTAYNGATIYQDVTVAPQDGPYVSLMETVFDDAAGNNNGLVDFGENILIDATLKNLGVASATGLSATITTDDTNVSITDGDESFGDLSPDASIVLDGAFAFTVNDNVEDGYSVSFTMEITDGTDVWESSFSVMLHAPVLSYVSYSIDDMPGGNGLIDAGETVNLLVTVSNTGSADITNVLANLVSGNGFVVVNTSDVVYGNLAVGEEATQSFEITADDNTPAGTMVEFTVNIESDFNYIGQGSFNEVVGQIPVLIIDLDGNNNSANEILQCVNNNSVSAELVSAIPADLSLYSSIFLCLGVYTDNHTLSSDEGQQFADYLNNGGKLYMEGGDTWAFDTQTAVHSMFGVNPEADGSGDMSNVVGTSSTFTDGMSFNYSGDNNYMDHISGTGSAYVILSNSSPAYGTAVANDAGTYKTIASSHELGGLDDGDFPSTRDELVKQYLQFFGIGGSGSTLAAQFIADETIICKMHTVNFTDQSIGGAIEWSWTFEGGDPATSTDQNPSVYYETPGFYDVTLEVTDGTETVSITKEEYIEVDICESVEETQNAVFALYPNPSQGKVFISINEETTIEVRTILGKQIKLLPTVSGDITIDLSSYGVGMYFVIAKTQDGSFVEKLILQ